MYTQTATLSKKLRTKFVDHVETVLIGELITERFNGPFVSRVQLENELDRRSPRLATTKRRR